MSFSPGDVVMLKSGGPIMTVTAVKKYTEGLDGGAPLKANCYWFNSTAAGHELKNALFDVATIETYAR